MRYELMLPSQIRTAIAENWPLVLPVGVLEYHGEHLALGMDTLVVTRLLDHLENELDMVILPPFYYGASSYAVAPPEGNGSVHVDAARLTPVAQDVLQALLRVGFRNIHVFFHHQTENFAAGMPPILLSSSRLARRSSHSSRGSAARVGGAMKQWRTTMRRNRKAWILSTGSGRIRL